MKIDFTTATFLLSVANLEQLPHDSGIEVAFAGRSNAGKSTALNILTKNKYLAKTSKTPGRTQLINFFSLDNHRRLVDLPGYGYAKVALDVKNRWQETLSEYLQSRKALNGIVLLMDIRHPLKDYDCHMIEWSVHANIPIHILLTKADKLTRNQANKVLQEVKKELSDIPNVTIQLFSALHNIGIDEFRGKLNEWFNQLSVNNSQETGS